MPFEKMKFNEEIGARLMKIREQSNVSLSEIENLLDGLRTDRLIRIENGIESIPCNLLYNLIQIYSPTSDDWMFFCTLPFAKGHLNDRP